MDVSIFLIDALMLLLSQDVIGDPLPEGHYALTLRFAHEL